ncbi:MAG: two-component system, chemotaxis family, chemotaxis protein CheY [Candidatus Hydrogenedentes bacterium]|nr:two-component system, chemotaxis family, chemotaxis protein CheY [Candidatus Hydrogenedentota bacterium]
MENRAIRGLVVDDSVVIRHTLVGILKQHLDMVRVDEACDGQEAVDAVCREDYDIILMDWNMPNLSGIDAVRAIRALGKATPIVMVTTESEKLRILDAIDAGANKYVLKPFTEELLIDRIKKALESA